MGAGIAGFGCFCWEIKQSNGETNTRPIFIISDAFVKNYKIKKERVFKLPRTTTIEEVNYSLLAIRFSKTLTKDMVFAGVRDIIRKIGDYIFRGYEICIEFTFGQLTAKDRKVKFEFNINRLQQILPETMSSIGTLPYDDSLLPFSYEEDENDTEILSSRYDRNQLESQPQSNSSRAATSLGSKRILPTLNLDLQPSSSDYKSILPPLSANLSSTNNHNQDTINPSITNSTKDFNRTINDEDNQQFDDIDDEEQLPTDLQSLLNTIAKKSKTVTKDEWREKARERVIDQAFLRCLETAENDANMNDAVANEARQIYEDWKLQNVTLKNRNKEQDRKIRHFLDSQVAERQLKTEQDKVDKKNTVMGVLFAKGDPNAGRDERVKISKDLAEQISINSKLKQKQKQDAVNKERDYLKQLSLEIDLHNAMERATHLEKQKSLLEAWEREGHIKNLRKVESYGKSAVSEYIQGNLAETTSTLKFPATTLGKSLNNSIGYDPRKGKM